VRCKGWGQLPYVLLTAAEWERARKKRGVANPPPAKRSSRRERSGTGYGTRSSGPTSAG